MPDPSSLTPRDFDPWQLATPQHLLVLLQRLGVSGREIARWLRVPRSSVSMWGHGTRAIPPKHIPPLCAFARLAFDQAVELNDKAAALAPTEALRQTLRTEFAAIWTEWKATVLRDAGTLRRGLQQQAEALVRLAGKPTFTAEDRETMALMMESMLAKMDLILQSQDEVPRAEEELITRLTQAHEAAAHARARSPEAGAEDVGQK